MGYNNLMDLPVEACTLLPNLEELLLPNNLLVKLPREVASKCQDSYTSCLGLPVSFIHRP